MAKVDLSEMKNAYELGLTKKKDIALSFGYTPQRLSQIANEHGWKWKSKSQAMRQEVAKEVEQKLVGPAIDHAQEYIGDTRELRDLAKEFTEELQSGDKEVVKLAGDKLKALKLAADLYTANHGMVRRILGLDREVDNPGNGAEETKAQIIAQARAIRGKKQANQKELLN